MSIKNIPFSPPDIRDEDINEVCEALRSGWITTGPRTKELEKKIAQYCGTDMTVCLNSATAALELNLRILGIGPGDEVIVPAYTYTATCSPVIHVGATPVMVDSLPDSTDVDFSALERKISSKTKAVILVDLAGIIADYDKAFYLAEKYKNIFVPSNRIQSALGRFAVIADCAHSLGAHKNGVYAGNIADFSSFSFHAVKNFTTAEGGAAVWRSIQGIDNNEIYKMFQLYSLHGQSKDALAKTKAGAWEYDIVGAWYKCNMTDIAAALGLKQLDRYESLLERRREIINKYDSMCDSINVKHLEHSGKDFRSSGHLYITRIPGFSAEQRNRIIESMAELGVACNVHYKPLPMMTAYKDIGFDISDYPNAFGFFENEVTLPLHTRLSDDDVEYVIECFKECVNRIRKEDFNA